MGSSIIKVNQMSIETKASIAYLISMTLEKAISFLTVPIFTRIISQEMYGQCTVYAAWSGLFSIILTLNLAYGSFSTAMMKFEDDREGYISAVEGICTTLLFVFLLIYFPFSTFWDDVLQLPMVLVLTMAVEIVADTAIQLWMGKKRFEYKYKAIVVVTLIRSILSPVIAFVAVICSQEKGIAKIVGYAIVTFCVGGVLLSKSIIQGKRFFFIDYWKYALGFNVPLLIYYLSQMIFNSSDRIMVGRILGNDKAAIYGIGYTLSFFLGFVLNAVNNAYVPWLYKRIKSNDLSQCKKISSIYALAFSAVLGLIVMFAPEIILIMSGAQYYGAVYVVPPASISLLLLLYTQFFTNIEFYYEKKAGLISSTVVAALLNIGLNLLLIDKLGFVAAAYTTLISYIVFSLWNYVSMKRILKSKKVDDELYDYKILLLIFGAFVILSIVSILLYGFFVIRICILCCMVLTCVLFRSRIRDLIDCVRIVQPDKNGE